MVNILCPNSTNSLLGPPVAINSFEMKSMKTILPAVWTSKAYCEALLKGKTLSAHYSYASGMAMPGEDGQVQGFEANMLRL